MTAGVGAKHLLINGSLGFNKIGIFAVDVWGNEVSAFAEYTVLADDGIVPNPIVWPVCDNERLDFFIYSTVSRPHYYIYYSSTSESPPIDMNQWQQIDWWEQDNSVGSVIKQPFVSASEGIWHSIRMCITDSFKANLQCSELADPVRSVCPNDDPTTTLITHYYASILSRDPEIDGLDYWRKRIMQNQAQDTDVKPVFRDMANFFFNSAEYLGRNTTDRQFITNLYLTFFQREPDEGGYAFWLERLAEGTPRNQVMGSFLYSPEFTAFMEALGF